jgi:hypothetical protein
LCSKGQGFKALKNIKNGLIGVWIVAAGWQQVVLAASKAYGASHKNTRRRLVAYSKGEEDVSESKMQQVMDFLEGLEVFGLAL